MTISLVSTPSVTPAARSLSPSAPAPVPFKLPSLPSPAQQPAADLAPAEAKPSDLQVVGTSDGPTYPKLEKEMELLPTPKEQKKEEFPPLKMEEEAQGTNLLANIQPTYFNRLVAKYANEVRPMSAALSKATEYLRSHPLESSFNSVV